jgi:hypothetical protein
MDFLDDARETLKGLRKNQAASIIVPTITVKLDEKKQLKEIIVSGKHIENIKKTIELIKDL